MFQKVVYMFITADGAHRMGKKCFTKEFLESQNTEMTRQSELALLTENVLKFSVRALGVEWV